MVLDVALRQAEVERIKEKERIEKVMAASLAGNRDDDDEDNSNNNNNDDDEDEDDEENNDDDTTQKTASTKMSPTVARKVVATKPLPKVVEGSSKANLVSHRVCYFELIHHFVV